jgi:hypothetical protein
MGEAELIQQIEQLSREQALEAAGFVADAITEENPPQIGAEEALKSITDEPYQNLEEIEQMARLLLMEAATIKEYQGYVQSAVEGAGKKQIILGGAEIVALAVISLGALHVILTKGKTYEGRTTKIIEEDGKTVVEIKEEIKYGISGTLASILKNIGGFGS